MHTDAFIDEKAVAGEWREIDDLVDRFMSFIDIIEEALHLNLQDSHRFNINVTEDFWETKVRDNESLADLRNAHESQLRDEMMRFDICIGQSNMFDPADCINIDNAVKFGHGRAKCVESHMAGLLNLFHPPAEQLPREWDDSRHMLITDDQSCKDYLRKWLSSLACSTEDFISIGKIVFPDLYFHPDLNLNDFHLHPDVFFSLLVKHLSFLNDRFIQIFSEVNKQPDHMSRRARADADIQLSPESPNTRANKKAIAERDVTIGNLEVRCEWHTKFFPQYGRIHFHPGLEQPQAVAAITDGRLIIGKFAEHLTV